MDAVAISLSVPTPKHDKTSLACISIYATAFAELLSPHECSEYELRMNSFFIVLH